MQKQLVERFANLFVGGQHAHGEWKPPFAAGEAKTIHSGLSLSHYEAHLDGKVGLGLVPVQSNGICRFGAIDVDVDTIDHNKLFRDVSERRFPLVVCRSKSGGAHLYLFTIEAGVPAKELRELLKKWATLLGYPSAEIFPKQNIISADNVGSWINLPYFAGEATTRYAVGPEGAMGLEEFLASIHLFDPNAQQNFDETASNGTAKMPPCLAALATNGVGQGQRNAALFNFAVFYRKSAPNNWENLTSQQNTQYFSPPMEFREVEGIIKSVGRAKYAYQCDQEPCKSLCDRQACLKLEFGINHAPWHEQGSFDEFVVTHCRKILTDPPKYIVEVNGNDVVLDWETLYSYQKFKSGVGQRLNIVVPNKKQPQWEMMLRDLLQKREEIQAPDDASLEGLVLDRFHEFLGLRERAQNKEDLLRGVPVTEGSHVLFRMGDFRRYLQGYRLDRIEGGELYLALRRDGCIHRRIRLNGRLVTVWAFPLDKVNTQTEEFAVADFKKDFGEEM